MNFEFTQQQNEFRQEVRDFLETEIAAGTFKPKCDSWIHGFSKIFSKKVAEKGWIGLSWPKEFGGQGRSQIDRLILTEEMLRYGAPAAGHWLGDRQIGRAIMAHGTPEQQEEILPTILKGEAFFGLGFSEPESGSDLASVQTRAVEDSDYFIINGQKIWTSCARELTHIYLVARTDADAPKHRGISEFIIDASLPGISINPTIDITGSEAWAEVFYDNVRVHKKYLIGTKNKGFFQILGQLDFERAGLERLMGNYPLYQGLMNFVKETVYNGERLCDMPLIRNRLAQTRIDFEIGRLLTYQVVLVMEKGKSPNIEAATAKFFCTTFEQKLASLATDIMGQYGQLLCDSKYGPLSGMAADSFMASKGYSLQGGTTEILKNIIATRGLGLG